MLNIRRVPYLLVYGNGVPLNRLFSDLISNTLLFYLIIIINDNCVFFSISVMESLKAQESEFLTSESSVKLAYTTGESCANEHNILNTPKSSVYGNDASIINGKFLVLMTKLRFRVHFSPKNECLVFIN